MCCEQQRRGWRHTQLQVVLQAAAAAVAMGQQGSGKKFAGLLNVVENVDHNAHAEF